MPTDPRLLITLCTYNERENLERLIPEIHEYAPHADLLVIDDNSPDGTGEYADEWAARTEWVSVLHRAAKLGLGSATLAGFQYGIDQGYDYLLNLDADFSHHPKYIPEMLAKMPAADVVIGSRYIPGGGVEDWGLRRKLMSGAINTYARLLLGLKNRDNSGSFRCYRVEKLAQLDLQKFVARGFAFEEEVLYRCRRIGCRFVEVPIVFADRRLGESKISLLETVAALWVILRLGVENLFRVRVTK